MKKILVIFFVLNWLGFTQHAEAQVSGKSLFNLHSSWTTQEKKKISLSALQGKPTVFTMIYTGCQQACPLILRDLRQIETKLGKLAPQANFVLVSFDAEHDSPERLKEFAAENHLNTHYWSLLHGDKEAIRELAAVLGVQYKVLPDGGFSHSNVITTLNTNGEIVQQHIGLGGNLEEIVESMYTLLKP